MSLAPVRSDGGRRILLLLPAEQFLIGDIRLLNSQCKQSIAIRGF